MNILTNEIILITLEIPHIYDIIRNKHFHI